MFDLDISPLLSGAGIASLLTLTLMEVVLGIDNIIFISILSDRLPESDQPKARKIGLSLALVVRLILLSFIAMIVQWTEPLATIRDFELSVRDLILFAGGGFLIYKSTTEIHDKLEGEAEKVKDRKSVKLSSVIVQIILLDIVFSFDSILTAVGLVDHLIIMISAVIVSMVIMLSFSGVISAFINKHPTIKMLALAFLLLIGVLLVLEAFHKHVPKGYIYSAIAFSLFVEMLNLRARKKVEPVKLKSKYMFPEKDDFNKDSV
jgi:predicted tellurium resistance membrane protein TerC